MLSFLRAAPPARTNTASHNPIVYEQGRSSVHFHAPASAFVMTHTIAPTTEAHGASILQPPFHVHLYQDEDFSLRSGVGRWYKGVGKEPFAVLSSAPGGLRTATIERGRYHRFENASETEDLVVDIALTPEDYAAEQRFFRNFMGYLDDCKTAGSAPSLFQIAVFAHSVDMPLALPLPWEWLGVQVSWVLLVVVAFIGRVGLGYRTTYAEYYEDEKRR